MEPSAIRFTAIKSAEQLLKFLEKGKTDEERNESRHNVEKIEHYGDDVILLTLASNLNDISLARLEVNGQKIEDKHYEFLSYDNFSRTVVMKAYSDEIQQQVRPGNESNVEVIHDFKFLIVRIRDYIDKYGSMLHFPAKAAMSPSQISIKSANEPSESQKEAIITSLTSPMSYIWGAPGTGKTQFVLANSIVNDLRQGKKVAVFAPTNVSVEQILYGLIAEIKHNPFFSEIINLDKDLLRVGQPSWDFLTNFPNMCEKKSLSYNRKIYERTIEALEETRNEMAIDELEDDFSKLRKLLSGYGDADFDGKEAIESLFLGVLERCSQIPFMNAAVKNSSRLTMEYSLEGLIQAAYHRPRPRRYLPEYENFTIADIDELIEKQREQLNAIPNSKGNRGKVKYAKKSSTVSDEGFNGASKGGANLKTAKVIVCTPHQFVHRMVPKGASGEGKHVLDIGHLYVDEVGYTNIMHVLPLFTNDCPITFLGDHMQLDPVFKMGRKLAIAEIKNHGQYCRAFLWGTSAIYSEELFFGKTLNDIESAYIDDSKPRYDKMKLAVLRKSYRFGENLARILDENVYGNIGLTGTDRNGNLRISCFSAPGERSGNANPSQVAAIKTIVEEFISDDSRSAIALAPYNNQVNALERALSGTSVKAMTIHKSQGREWDTVIISVTDSDPYGGGFMDTRELRNLKLVNTAVSRAKKHLIIVCDYNQWAEKDDELISKLIDYAKSVDELYEPERCF